MGRGFNPHPPVGAGAIVPSLQPRDAPRAFQSSPARGGGCNPREQTRRPARFWVSILTCPWGRVQLGVHGAFAQPFMVSILTRPWGRVQRCNERVCDSWVAVSILTRPGGRVQHLLGFSPYYSAVVSILTRPWGRVQLRSNPQPSNSLLFQSSPARGGGCNRMAITR